MNPLSHDLKILLSLSREEAIRLGSYSVMPDHLFLGLLRMAPNNATDLLNQIGADLKAIKKEIEDLIGFPDPVPYENANQVNISEEVKQVFSVSIKRLVADGKEPTPAHILVAILSSDNNNVRKVLSRHGINADAVILKFANSQMENSREEGSSSKKETSVLSNYGYDLTKAAMSGRLDPVVGREAEIERLAQILGRRKKNNPILIGESGVGKSAIVEGLAAKIAKKSISRSLIDKKIISLDMGAVVAGTKYRGQFEERIKSILSEIKDNPNIILFIDEMHTLVGAGGAPGSLDAANLLKPALARGEIQCIGATTLDEYREIIEKDGALERRFQKIMVDPTNYDQTLAILKGIQGKYESFHNVIYTDEAVKSCISLSQRYISSRCLPDKAIDVMDEAGSRVHIGNTGVPEDIEMIESEIDPIRLKKREAVLAGDFKTSSELHYIEKEKIKLIEEAHTEWSKADSTPKSIVNEEDIAEVVSVMSNIPVHKIAESESQRLMNMDNILKTGIIGQDDAICKVVKAIRRSRAGLKDPNKPIGSFLFLGPTGVGKTQLAKKIAEYMFDSEDNIVRIDMSEYIEKFSVSRLIGAPPGYVGYNEGGQLSEQIRRKPYSVVLLDEVEKAHPDIFNVLLQVLDEGRLTDSNGRYIDFKNTILILTSNIGSRELKDFGSGVGFSTSSTEAGKNTKNIINKALSKVFSPEFLNRLDEQIYFNTLTKEDICQIIDIELKDLLKRIRQLGYNLSVDKEAKKFIAEVGYDPKFGARPLKRAIQKYVEDPVSETIIEGRIKCSDITITLNKEKNNTVVERTATDRRARTVSATKDNS